MFTTANLNADYFIKNVMCQFGNRKINLHESLVFQALQVGLEAQGLLLFLCPLALQSAHAHQAPPDSVIKRGRQAGKNQSESYNKFHITNRKRSTDQITCDIMRLTKGLSQVVLFSSSILNLFCLHAYFCWKGVNLS